MFCFSKTTNQIDTIPVLGFPGALGLVACPGVRLHEPNSFKRFGRNVRQDLREILHWRANGVVTLMEEDELVELRLFNLPNLLEKQGLWWRFMPIIDMDVPDVRFERAWKREGERLRRLLQKGERIIIHCFAGLGRTGMIAARLLVELGMNPADAIKRVREPNTRRIQTKRQYNFVKNCQPIVQMSTQIV